MPLRQNEDMNPLDRAAEKCNHPVIPQYNSDQDPVLDAYKQLESARIMFVSKQLLFSLSAMLLYLHDIFRITHSMDIPISSGKMAGLLLKS